MSASPCGSNASDAETCSGRHISKHHNPLRDGSRSCSRSRSRSRSPPRVVRVTYKGRSYSMPLRRTQVPVRQLQNELSDAIFPDEPDKLVTGFVYDSFGPVCPLLLMGDLLHGCELEILASPARDYQLALPPRAPRVGPTSLSWSEMASADDAAMYEQAKILVGDLQRFGYAKVSLDQPDYMKTVNEAYDWIARFMDLPTDTKYRSFYERPDCPNRKYAGFARQGPREFFQLRKTPRMDLVWPDDRDFDCLKFEDTQTRLYRLMEKISRACFFRVGAALGIPQAELEDLLDAPGNNLRCPEGEVGANVMRSYRILRSASERPPGLSKAATGLHADFGLITVAPRANLPGLVVLDPSSTHWVAVEEGAPASEVSIMVGETLSQLVQGRVRSGLHFVDEKDTGVPRYSIPFFLRARPDAVVDRATGMTAHEFVECPVMVDRPWGKAYSDY